MAIVESGGLPFKTFVYEFEEEREHLSARGS
jgi:hypothetical protein